MLLNYSIYCLFCGMSDVNLVLCVCMGTGLDQSSWKDTALNCASPCDFPIDHEP